MGNGKTISGVVNGVGLVPTSLDDRLIVYVLAFFGNKQCITTLFI